MKKSVFLRGIFVLFFAFAVVFAGCEGPAGPQGPQGPVGEFPSRLTPTVFFTSDISSEGLLRIFQEAFAYGGLNIGEFSDVAVKIHSGEPGSFFLQPDLIVDLVEYVDGTLVETNTSRITPIAPGATPAPRRYPVTHLAQFQSNFPGFDVRVLDGDTNDGNIAIQVPGGRRINSVFVGPYTFDFDYYIVLSHFTGHFLSGFGAALKNLGMGLAAPQSKNIAHVPAFAGPNAPQGAAVGPDGLRLNEAVAEAGLAIVLEMQERLGHRPLYITVLNNMSMDCDCFPDMATGHFRTPDIADIGIIASFDPVAIDQAAMDLIWMRNRTHSRADHVAGITDPVLVGRLPVHSTDPANVAFPTSAVRQGARADGEGIGLLEFFVSIHGQSALDHGERIGLGRTTYILYNID